MQQSTSSIPTVSGDVAAQGDAIDVLLNDHVTIKSLLSQLTQAGEPTQRRRILEQLKGLLTIHNATEENLVYPAIAQVAGKKHESQHLYHETAEADVVMFQMDTLLKEHGDPAKFEALAQSFQKALLEHIDDEEEKAFPHLREHAEPQQARLLTQSVHELRSALQYKPPSGVQTPTA
jgi:hemerythrin superfamily protein